MKKIATILLVTFVFASCKKSTDTDSPINGKWSLRPTIYELYTNGVIVVSTDQSYQPGDYVDFKTNGRTEIRTNGTTYNHSFTLVGDTLTFENINKAKVSQLSANSLIYYFKDSINPTQYRISRFTLFK